MPCVIVGQCSSLCDDASSPWKVLKYKKKITLDLHLQKAFYFSGPSDNPIQPTGPSTPISCDPRLTFDAITTLRGEILFFKDKYKIELFLPLAYFTGIT